MSELVLFVREGERVVSAPMEDVQLARSYPEFKAKGTPHSGYRLTILTRSSTYRLGEEIRVLHICEAITPGTQLYVMGPKRIYGEFVDDPPVTPPPLNSAEPLTPSEPYDGHVVPGPGIDANYEITRYRFDVPGIHTISWRLGELASNVLRIEVMR
jgi:hypothetical protein